MKKNKLKMKLLGEKEPVNDIFFNEKEKTIEYTINCIKKSCKLKKMLKNGTKILKNFEKKEYILVKDVNDRIILVYDKKIDDGDSCDNKHNYFSKENEVEKSFKTILVDLFFLYKNYSN